MAHVTLRRLGIALSLLLHVSLACTLPEILAGQTFPDKIPPPTITHTPQPSPTPRPTPTPTPAPAARITAGDQAIFYGDWETAQSQFQTVLDNNSDPELQAAAHLGLARVAYLTGAPEMALTRLTFLLENYPQATILPEAYYHLAEIYGALEHPAEAAEAYGKFLALRPGIIDAYILEWQGDAWMAASDYAAAQTAYQQAILARTNMLADPNPEAVLELKLKQAQTAAALGDAETALALYAEVYQNTASDYTRAEVDLYVGRLYLNLNQPQAAYEAFLDAVANFPLSYDSYSALVALVQAGVPVNELDRGLVDYFAGQYSLAVAAFERFLANPPPDADSTAYYYRALALLALGEIQAAIDNWSYIIETFPPEDRFWISAWEQKAHALWAYQEEYQPAANLLLSFVERYPNLPQSPDFLFSAARILERGGFFKQAAETWNRLAEEYPQSDLAYRARFLAGITSYRRQDLPNASESFAKALAIAHQPEQQAGAHFWLGKVAQANGDQQNAHTHYQQALLSDPTGYYSERARDLLLGRPPFSPPPRYDISPNLAAERQIAEAWLRQEFQLTPETDLSGLGELLNDPRLIRGNELWQLGRYSQARAELESLRQASAQDPIATYRLANYFAKIGLYRSAIFAARNVLDLAGMDYLATLTAPQYFNYLRFGPYYRELIVPLAQSAEFHPLLVFSIVRQESLFEGFIRSPAGARGLMQIIPSTGQGLADSLGWPPNFTPDDLYLPNVSLRLGIAYLSQQRTTFEGDLYAALAAYNAGPGNAFIWKQLAPDDPDLFLEVIRYDETRQYIRRIYEIFTTYRRLYGRSG